MANERSQRLNLLPKIPNCSGGIAIGEVVALPEGKQCPNGQTLRGNLLGHRRDRRQCRETARFRVRAVVTFSTL